MGILNVTPDSFFDGGRYLSPADAIRQTEKMIREGADIIDVGGESTRPSSLPVSEEEEIGRVLPVIREIVDRFDIPVSIDTYRSKTARVALREGAEIINDISGLTFDPDMARTASEFGAGLVVMHIRGTPRTMQLDTEYGCLVTEVCDRLAKSIERAERAGLAREHIVVDPGIGFGKSLNHNYELIRSIPRLKRLGRPVLIGPSRKSFVWKLLDCTPSEALEGSIAASIFSYLYGADALRVHDVGAVRRALIVAEKFLEDEDDS